MERNALSEDAPFHSQTMRLFSGSVIAAGHQHGHDGVVVVISGLDAFGKLYVHAHTSGLQHCGNLHDRGDGRNAEREYQSVVAND